MKDSQFYIQWNWSKPLKAKHCKMLPCSVNIMTKYFYVLKLLITPSSGFPIHQLCSNYTTFFWSYRLHFSGILDLQITWYMPWKKLWYMFRFVKNAKNAIVIRFASSIVGSSIVGTNGCPINLKIWCLQNATIMKAQANAWQRFVATEISMVSIEKPHSDSFYAKLNHSICLKPFLCSIKLRPLILEPKSNQWMICHEAWHKIPSFRMQLCTFAEISLKIHVFSVNKKKDYCLFECSTLSTFRQMKRRFIQQKSAKQWNQNSMR